MIELMTIKEICELLKISTTTFSWLRFSDDFPKPIEVGRRARFFKKEVIDWFRSRERIEQ